MVPLHSIKIERTLLICVIIKLILELTLHFFATSHGKGPCNGLGGTVKLQRAYIQMMTSRQLYE